MPRRSSTGSAWVTSVPSSQMRPVVGSMSRLIILSVVDLPQPGRTDEADHLAAAYVEVELVDRDRAVVVRLAHAGQADHRVGVRTGGRVVVRVGGRRR